MDMSELDKIKTCIDVSPISHMGNYQDYKVDCFKDDNNEAYSLIIEFKDGGIKICIKGNSFEDERQFVDRANKAIKDLVFENYQVKQAMKLKEGIGWLMNK